MQTLPLLALIATITSVTSKQLIIPEGGSGRTRELLKQSTFE